MGAVRLSVRGRGTGYSSPAPTCSSINLNTFEGMSEFSIMNFQILIVSLVLGRTDLISDDGLLKPFLLLAGQWNDITVLAIRTLFY